MSEEDYNKEPTKHADMTTLILQGNLDSVNSLMTYLSLAADTSKHSWMTRLRNSAGLDGLIDKYEKENPSIAEPKITALMKADYDEKAKSLADKLNDLNESLKVYTDCTVKADTDYTKVTEYFKEHTDESVEKWSKAGAVYLMLSSVKLGDNTFADIVTGSKYDFSKADDRMELYPIIDSMSQGERALLKYVDLGDMLITGTLNAAGWAEFAKKNTENLKGSKQNSVYAGIDRSTFQPAGVALTSEARQIQSATGNSYANKLFGVDTTYVQIAGYATAALLIGAGVAAYVHGKNVTTTIKTVIEAKSNTIFVTAMDVDDQYGSVVYSFKDYLEESKEIAYVGKYHLSDLESNEKEATELYKLFLNNETVDVTTDEGKKYAMNCKDMLKEAEEKSAIYKEALDTYEEMKNQVEGKVPVKTEKTVSEKIVKGSKGWKIAGVECALRELLSQ